MTYKPFLINCGSVEDIRSSLRCNEDNAATGEIKGYTAEEMSRELAYEKSHMNRSSVKKLLIAAINKRLKNKS